MKIPQNDNLDHILEDENKRYNVVGISILIMVTMIFFGLLGISCLTGCTLSFTNVMTDGTASDVVDSDPRTDAKVDSKLTIPAKLM